MDSRDVIHYKVLVIGGDHHNTLGVIESLGVKGVFPYVLAITNTSWAYVLKSRYVVDGCVCHNETQIVEWILTKFNDSDHKAVAIATCDLAASILDKNYNQLSPFLILPNTSISGNLANTMSKEYMSSLAREVGLNVPKTWVVTDGSVPHDIEYPCITKAISSVVGTKENICVCRDEESLHRFLSKKAKCPIIQIQKFVDKEYEFQLLGCSMGYGKEILIPGRTHIVRPNGLDNTFFLRFDKIEPEYNSLVEKVITFIKRTGYQGPFSVEFLRDKDGTSYFTEMNFRNDGNAYCETSAGTNIPYIYYLYNTGGDYQTEIKKSFVKTTYLTPEFYYFKNMMRGEYGIKEWWHNMKITTCYTTYFKDDKKPFFWFLLQVFEHGINALKRKFKK